MKYGEVCKVSPEVFISAHLLNQEMTPAGAPDHLFKLGTGVEKD